MPARTRALVLAVAMTLTSVAVAAEEGSRARVALRWTRVADAVAYELEIARDPAFQDVVLRERVALTGYRWNTLPTRTFHWRVRSVDASGRLGDWSSAGLIQPAVGPPKLVSAVVDPKGITVTVEPSSLLRSFGVELSPDRSFQRGVSRHPSTAATWTLPVPPPGTYFLRTRGVDLEGRETDPGEVRTLVIELGTPVLSRPRANEAFGWTSPPPAIELGWLPVVGARSYQLRILLEGDARETSVNVVGLHHRFVPRGPGAYRWRVRAVGDSGAGGWSEPRPLFVGLDAPVVLKPAPNTKVTTRQPTASVEVVWQPVPGAAGYIVQLARDPDFASIATSQRLGAADRWTLTGIVPGLYFLRVATEGPDGSVASAAAPRKLEVVSAAALAAPRLLSPASGRALPDSTPVEFLWAAVPDAAEYELEVESFEIGREPVLRRGPEVRFTLQDLPHGDHAWRVRALDKGGAAGAWSERRRLYVGVPLPQRAEIALGEQALNADGRSTTSVSVTLLDAHGVPIRGAHPTVTATSGTVSATTEEDGRYLATYTAPEQVPVSGNAWILVRERTFEATTQLALATPNGRIRVGADLGWNASFGLLSSPYLGLTAEGRLPVLGYRLGLGLRTAGYFGGRTVPGLAGDTRADAAVLRAALLVSFDQVFPWATVYGAAGPSLQGVRVAFGELVTTGWAPGLQVLLGGLRKFGPGALAGELSYTFADFADDDVQLRAGGLTLTLGYRVTLL